MNLVTVAGIIIASCGVLIVGMAALIKTMIIGKLDEIRDSVSELQADNRKFDVRLTKLETEHKMRCGGCEVAK